MSGPIKVCSCCEGEGLLTHWGRYGHEVPASRQTNYPKDLPPEGTDTSIYVCDLCAGKGRFYYDDRNRRVPA